MRTQVIRETRREKEVWGGVQLQAVMNACTLELQVCSDSRCFFHHAICQHSVCMRGEGQAGRDGCLCIGAAGVF